MYAVLSLTVMILLKLLLYFLQFWLTLIKVYWNIFSIKSRSSPKRERFLHFKVYFKFEGCGLLQKFRSFRYWWSIRPRTLIVPGGMNLNETSSPFAVEVRVWPYSMCGHNDIKQTLKTRKG